MAVGGLWLGHLVDARGGLRRSHLAAALIGAGLVALLVAFMWDALAVAAGLAPAPPPGSRAVPVHFPWLVYAAGDILAVAGGALLLRRQHPQGKPAI